MKHGHNMEDIFDSMDTNRDGELDYDEFERALNKMGIRIDREEV